MILNLEFAGAQIDGDRDYQEDAFLTSHLGDKDSHSVFLIVADGMGGHAAGNVASNLVVQAFSKHVNSSYYTSPIQKVLKEAVTKANTAISMTIQETPALQGMGCTLVAAVIDEDKLWWASVGDSHLYLIRDKKLIKLNADHSYGGFLDRMEEEGNIVTPDPSLARNMLISAITGEEIKEIDIPIEPERLQDGDRLILCSDGMDTLNNKKLVEYVDWFKSPRKTVEALVQSVEDLKIPRQDNTTAIFLQVSEKVSEKKTAEQTPESVTKQSRFKKQQETAPISAPIEIKEGHKQTDIRKILNIAVGGLLTIVLFILGFYLYVNPSPFKRILKYSEQILLDGDNTEEIDSKTTTKEIATDTEEDIEQSTTVSANQNQQTKLEPTKAIAIRKFRDNLTSGGKGPVMIVIPDGEFMMGSGRYPNESPKHKVFVKAVAISEKEISIDEYNQFARDVGAKAILASGLDAKLYPVTGVSWDNAYNYTQWLSRKTSKRYRLATEAEWEYAASTGKKSNFWWGYKMEPGRAHCLLGCNIELNSKIPVRRGLFPKNSFGLYDTAGNVAEWVHECWHNNYKNAPNHSGIWEGGDCLYRVVRGGSYINPEKSLRHAHRDKHKGNEATEYIGIRIARDL